MKKKTTNTIIIYCGVISTICGTIGTVFDLVKRLLSTKPVVLYSMSKSWSMDKSFAAIPLPIEPTTYWLLGFALFLLIIGIILFVKGIRNEKQRLLDRIS